MLGEMRKRDGRLVYVAFVLIVSTFGLMTSASLLSTPVTETTTPHIRWIWITILYGAVCLVGTTAVLFPVACSGVLGTRIPFTEDAETPMTRTTRVFGAHLVHGHHPAGPETESHELRIGGKSYCASCFGLLTGATASLIVVVAFAFHGWPAEFDLSFAYGLYCVGVVGAVLGLFQTLAFNPKPWARFFLAVFFAVGTGFMLIATDVLTASVMADLLVILLAVFWVLSRISLSHRSRISPA